jgi:Zn-dependent protease with chaperone function
VHRPKEVRGDVVALSNQLTIGFIKVFLWSALSFFLIPGITYAFVQYAKPQIDASYIKAIELSVNGQAGLTVQQKEELLEFVRATPPSVACASDDPAIQDYRDNVCPAMSDVWQFYIAEKLSWWSLVGGAGVFLIIFVLGALAFVNRAALYYSFLAGWRFLVAASAVEVVVQGMAAVWLSFWVTAFFFQFYILKIILIVAILAFSAAGYAVWWIFKRAASSNDVEGELLLESAEPALWARVRALARRIETAPPDHIVAGIDSSFFVTQTPLTVGGRELRGRILFVSLPLVRQFSETEADTVLAHELAHFRGGDTRSQALLGPKLHQFDLYRAVMAHKGVFIASCILRLYRLIFELALKRESRKREFVADTVAASAVSGQGLIAALIKLSAYSGYLGHVQHGLFMHDERHQEPLSIAGRMAAGLQTYAASPEFINEMSNAHTPHPFDTHPNLADRMKNVGCTVEAKDFAAIVTAHPGRTWVDDISGADAIEKRLWSKYEEAFASRHEKSLAYRYLPANEQEEDIVLQYFPNMRFGLAKNRHLDVTYAGVTVPPSSAKEQAVFISWDDVENLTLQDKQFFLPHKLIIKHPRSNSLRRGNTTVPLAGVGKQLQHLNQVLAVYLQRHQIMRQAMTDRASVPLPEASSG